VGKPATSRARRSVACEGTARPRAGPSCSLPGQACPNARERDPCTPIDRPRRRNGPKWKNSLATCDAIKERRTASPLQQKTGNNQNDYLTGKAPYKSSELLFGNRTRCSIDTNEGNRRTRSAALRHNRCRSLPAVAVGPKCIPNCLLNQRVCRGSPKKDSTFLQQRNQFQRQHARETTSRC
jgi:hypothetical protein